MKLSDLFTELSYGELSNLKIGMEGTGSIRDADRPRVVSVLNDTLAEIFARYLLREVRTSLLLNTSTVYNLTAEDLVQIIEARTDNPFDHYIGMNRASIQFLMPPKGTTLDLTYQALHPRLALAPADESPEAEATYLAQEITIPWFLAQAVRALVAARLLSVTNSDPSNSKAAEHTNRANVSLAQLEASGMLTPTTAALGFAPRQIHDSGFEVNRSLELRPEEDWLTLNQFRDTSGSGV